MNRRITVLQTVALPLGYAAFRKDALTQVRGTAQKPQGSSMERKTGFEPATATLARWSSTGLSYFRSLVCDIRLWQERRPH